MVNDYKRLFEKAPDLYLVLTPDLVISGASDLYLKATFTSRDSITGRHLFEVFPDNPDDPGANGVSNLRFSLETVLRTRAPHDMAVQKYDIRTPSGTFEERYWKPLNIPVLDDDGAICCIIHRVEDVTEIERIKILAAQEHKQKQELEELTRKQLQQLKASEERFFKIFNLCPVSLYVVGIDDGRIIQVNRAFEQLFQLSREDVVGKTPVELMLTDEQHQNTVAELVKESAGHIVELEMPMRIATGEIKSMLVSIEIIKMDHKKCFLGAVVDISRRAEMEHALMQANKFLDTVLENIPDMVFVKDAKDLRFIRFNKAGEEMLGHSRNDLIGKNDYDFFPIEQADAFTAKDREVFAANKVVDVPEEPIQTVNGERWLHTKKIPVFYGDEPMYLVGISEDITARKKQQDSIQQLNKELEAFTYTVSHDLRSPLRAMTGYAQMLEEDYGKVLDQEGLRQLGIISSNAEKMGRLIDELLSFSHIGRRELQKTSTNMNELVSGVVREINRSVAHNADIRVGELHGADTDPALMSQVLVNLIGNAIKYSSKKDAPVVEISSEQEGDNIIFYVKDNGAGFDMRFYNKLFGVFQRLHAADEFDGTGVGLAIVQRIIQKHGGKISATGKPDEGAVFYFSLPRKQS